MKGWFMRSALLRAATGAAFAFLPLCGCAVPPPDPVATVEAPGSEQIGELLRLGRIGHIRAIEATLSRMEAEASAPPAFVAQMRGLVEGYDLRRYLSVLQGLARNG